MTCRRYSFAHFEPVPNTRQMAKVLIKIKTSAFAAHIARSKWGEAFDLNARQHNFLYMLVVHLPMKKGAAVPTFKHDYIEFYVPERYARNAKGFETSIGAKLHDYFIEEANTFLEGHHTKGEIIKDAVQAYMDKWNFADDILDDDTLKKSFYRKRLAIEKYPINRHFNVSKIKKRLTYAESVEVKRRQSVQLFLCLTSTKKIEKKDIQTAVSTHFGVVVEDLYHPRPAGNLARAKKLYCFLMYCLIKTATFRSLEKTIGLTHRQIFQNVKDVAINASFDEDLEKLNLLLYGTIEEPSPIYRLP